MLVGGLHCECKVFTHYSGGWLLFQKHSSLLTYDLLGSTLLYV